MLANLINFNMSLSLWINMSILAFDPLVYHHLFIITVCPFPHNAACQLWLVWRGPPGNISKAVRAICWPQGKLTVAVVIWNVHSALSFLKAAPSAPLIHRRHCSSECVCVVSQQKTFSSDLEDKLCMCVIRRGSNNKPIHHRGCCLWERRRRLFWQRASF